MAAHALDIDDAEEDFYLMASLWPKSTGLPFVVWVSEKGKARHDARVKVGQAAKSLPLRASVSVRPDVEVKSGSLPASDLAALREWIDLNREALLAYWRSEIDTADLIGLLKRIES